MVITVVEASKAALGFAGEGEITPRKANTLAVIDFILGHLLRLFHPFMPFITEELWHGLGFLDGVLADLAGHVAVDRGDGGLHALFRQIRERHLEARKRTHMGNSVAHLTGADDAHSAYVDHDIRPLALRPSPPRNRGGVER